MGKVITVEVPVLRSDRQVHEELRSSLAATLAISSASKRDLKM